MWQQYLAWVGLMPGPNGWSGLLQGNWGWSFEYNQPVNLVVGQALLLTLVVNLAAVVFVHIVAIPIAIYSAVRQYSIGDYLVTFIGYIGLATPSFLLALVLLYYLNRWFGVSIGGLMDPAYADQAWSVDKMHSIASHLIVPTVVIGLASTAAMIRRMRANLLDELQKQYVVTARAKGLSEGRLLLKYPFRMSLNPFIADIGNILPHLDFRIGAGLAGAQPAHGRANSAAGAAGAGPISRRLHLDVRRHADGDRHADLGPRARGARSAHPFRRTRRMRSAP